MKAQRGSGRLRAYARAVAAVASHNGNFAEEFGWEELVAGVRKALPGIRPRALWHHRSFG